LVRRRLTSARRFSKEFSRLPLASGAREIVSFKERHAAELRRMRKRIERELRDICLAPDEDERAARTQFAVTELRDEAEELVCRMKEHGWREVAWGVLVAVAATGELVRGLAGHDAAAIAVSLPIAAAAARDVATSRRSSGIEGEPLAYAALAHRRFADAA